MPREAAVDCPPAGRGLPDTVGRPCSSGSTSATLLTTHSIYAQGRAWRLNLSALTTFIVQCVLETDGILLHNDVDFEKIKAVRPLPWPVR